MFKRRKFRVLFALSLLAWGFLRDIMSTFTRKEKCYVTRAEFAARKRWDTSIMTEEEKEARMQRILSHCGKIDDETFTVHDDPIPAITEAF